MIGIIKLKWTTMLFIIMATVSNVLSQNIISPAVWDEQTLTQEQTIRFNKVSNYYGSSYLTKIDVLPISSIIDNEITIDIPNSSYPAITFKGKHVEYVSEDEYSWYGEIDFTPEDSCRDTRYGHMLLISQKGEKFGQIKLEEENYTIEDVGGKNLLLKHPPFDGELCGGSITPDPNFHGGSGGEAGVRDLNCEMKVLVLYTSAAKDRVNNINNIIISCINVTNQAFLNSSNSALGCDFYLELAGAEEINIDETGKLFSDILYDEVQDNPVVMERGDFYDADIVVLMIDRLITNDIIGGLAFKGTSISNAFAVLDVYNADVNNVFSHEVGHIIGGDHEPCDAEDPGSGCLDIVFTSDQRAHTWSYKTGCWPFRKNHKRKTIMYSKVSSDVIPYYSNPDKKVDGHETGIIDKRDNYKEIENRACLVANFRSQTDNLAINIDGPFTICPLDLATLSAIAGGTQGPYTYEWKVSTSGVDWDILPVTSTSSQIDINTFSYNLDYGDVLFIRLRVTAGNGTTATDYHSLVVAQEGEFGCPHSSNQPEEVKPYLKVYPNPSRASTTLIFSLLTESEVDINIYDSNGKIVKSFNKGKLPIGYYRENIDFLKNESSIYFVELIKGNNIERTSFTIIK